MISRFDAETVALVAETEKLVARRLGVETSYLCICSGPNNAENKGEVSLCFETDEDDVFANLCYDVDPSVDLKDVLWRFMTNRYVEWREKPADFGLENLSPSEVLAVREMLAERRMKNLKERI